MLSPDLYCTHKCIFFLNYIVNFHLFLFCNFFVDSAWTNNFGVVFKATLSHIKNSIIRIQKEFADTDTSRKYNCLKETSDRLIDKIFYLKIHKKEKIIYISIKRKLTFKVGSTAIWSSLVLLWNVLMLFAYSRWVDRRLSHTNITYQKNIQIYSKKIFTRGRYGKMKLENWW